MSLTEPIVVVNTALVVVAPPAGAHTRVQSVPSVTSPSGTFCARKACASRSAGLAVQVPRDLANLGRLLGGRVRKRSAAGGRAE